ncbi:hypothetical protein [Trinickia symbiotica]|uniref:Uncharacterized protein n=1 Tax=Trinickia symbiotica TaxID=863227 RepID=A0A2N7X9Q3_9BURK|nr:hypothetical protein [Trinickia symbiotica]PMS38483.1 hypothetical protein C0Z20_00950 [Trinickia symbiotica]
MKAWDTAIIKADSNHAQKGRAGVVQAVNEQDGKVTIRLDETADGKLAKVVDADIADVDVKHVL